MKTVIEFLRGKKTYILAVIVVSYAVASALGYVPEPEAVQAFLVVVAGFAFTLRAALAVFYNDVMNK